MDISLGFAVIMFLVIFPGLLYRRLYYYGEFSKQYNAGHNLLSLIAVSIIPGLINLIFISILYDSVIVDIDIDGVIDKFKDIKSPDFRLKQSNGTPIDDLITDQLAPFIGFLYISSIIIGVLSGRFVRISRIDTKFKLLRFKNYWFYLFNGQHTSFKKMKHLKKKQKKHLFTNADILIDLNNKSQLYSGIVVDYEIKDTDCRELSKVMLQNAKRYSLNSSGKISPTIIPGNILVVDCSEMRNINLTFIYEETENKLNEKLPVYIEIGLGVVFLLLLPIFIFQAQSIKIDFYEALFSLSWLKRFIAYLVTVQIIYLLNPFIKRKNTYTRIKPRDFFTRIIVIAILTGILCLLG